MKSSPQLVRETLLQMLFPERRGSGLRDVPASPATRKSTFLCEEDSLTESEILWSGHTRPRSRGDLICRSVNLSLGVVGGSDPESGAFGKRRLE